MIAPPYFSDLGYTYYFYLCVVNMYYRSSKTIIFRLCHVFVVITLPVIIREDMHLISRRLSNLIQTSPDFLRTQLSQNIGYAYNTFFLTFVFPLYFWNSQIFNYINQITQNRGHFCYCASAGPGSAGGGVELSWSMSQVPVVYADITQVMLSIPLTKKFYVSKIHVCTKEGGPASPLDEQVEF